MACQKCNSGRILSICGKTSDRCGSSFADRHHDGYVPANLGVGGGDYLEFDVCLDCGQMQGTFPITEEATDAAFLPEPDEVEDWAENLANDPHVIHAPVDKMPFNRFKPVVRMFEGTYSEDTKPPYNSGA